MTKAFSYAEIVRNNLLPVLEKGAENGGAELAAEDCEKLIFFLKTSVPLEPFLETFVSLIHNTIAEASGGDGDGQ